MPLCLRNEGGEHLAPTSHRSAARSRSIGFEETLGSHGRQSRMIALIATSSFRTTAASASFCGLPPAGNMCRHNAHVIRGRSSGIRRCRRGAARFPGGFYSRPATVAPRAKGCSHVYCLRYMEPRSEKLNATEMRIQDGAPRDGLPDRAHTYLDALRQRFTGTVTSLVDASFDSAKRR
jgi:hypothetical protein